MKYRLKIRSQLLVVLFIFFLLGILGPVVYLTNQINNGYYASQEDALIDFAELTAVVLSENIVTGLYGDQQINTRIIEKAFKKLEKRSFSADIHHHTKDKVRVRAYITNTSGRVIYDSDNNRDLGQIYLDWRDVNYALQGEYGARTTFGDPLSPDGYTMYVAAPIFLDDEIIGSLSIGKSTEVPEVFGRQQVNKIFLSALLILVILVLFGYVIRRKLTRPLEEIVSYAQVITSGKKTDTPDFKDDEIGDVGRALEEMKDKLDGKAYISDYVENITHEIKAPIAGIKGSAELLKKPINHEANQRFLNNIVTQTERIEDLVDRMLKLASLEYQTSLVQQENNVSELIYEVTEDFKAIANSKKVEFKVNSDTELSLVADTFLLKQALSNLVKNALEYSPSNGLIEITAHKDKSSIALSVTDEGPGIPDYAKNKIFDRFYSTPKPSGGNSSGLGLCFVKEIMSLHLGSVVVESSEGKGTTMTLLFTNESDRNG